MLKHTFLTAKLIVRNLRTTFVVIENVATLSRISLKRGSWLNYSPHMLDCNIIGSEQIDLEQAIQTQKLEHAARFRNTNTSNE